MRRILVLAAEAAHMAVMVVATRRTGVLSASAALAVLLVGAAGLLWTQQAQAEEACDTSENFCIAKTADRSTVTVGEQITFTITERCLIEGTICGTGSPLVDTLPSGLTVVSVVDAGPEQKGNYECITDRNTVTCPVPRYSTFAQPFTLTIVATTTECGSFTNTASSGLGSVDATFTVEGCVTVPTMKEQCKKGGWSGFGYPDQGTCITAFNENRR
jgi:uncharacterized repeat protein (TIGR01451 family)